MSLPCKINVSRGTNWSLLMREDLTSLWDLCPERETFLNARNILSLCCGGSYWFRQLYSLGIIFVTNFCICSMLLVISATSRPNSTESHVLETFVRQFSRVFYCVLNPVNMPDISDKP